MLYQTGQVLPVDADVCIWCTVSQEKSRISSKTVGKVLPFEYLNQ